MKTVELTEEAVARLEAWKKSPDEPLSEVVLRTVVAPDGAAAPVAITEEMLVAKPWLRSFGSCRDLREELHRIDKVIEEEFGQIEPEQWK